MVSAPPTKGSAERPTRGSSNTHMSRCRYGCMTLMTFIGHSLAGRFGQRRERRSISDRRLAVNPGGTPAPGERKGKTSEGPHVQRATDMKHVAFGRDLARRG